MGFLLGSALAALLVTALAARMLVSYAPQASAGTQILWATLSFPLQSVALFAIATVVALVGAADAPPNQGAGMAVFALVFFLVYAVVVGVVIGLPTAWVAVRSFRG